MTPRAAPLLLAATLAALGPLGCGNDKAARAQFNKVRADCATLVGSTIDEAQAKFLIPPFVGCVSSLPSLGSGDVCAGTPPGPYPDPICLVTFEYCASGTSLCGPGGCAYECELRVAVGTQPEVVGSSVICATTFISGQPFGLLSGGFCQ